MSTRYKVQHRTIFDYSADVTLSQQLLKITPRQTATQAVEQSAIFIDPAPVLNKADRDYFDNSTVYVALQAPHQRLVIQAVSTVCISFGLLPELHSSAPWETVVQSLLSTRDPEAASAAMFCFSSPHVEIPVEIGSLVQPIFTPGRPLLEAAMALTTLIHNEFSYQGGVTDVHTAVSEVLSNRRGVCQDFAHLQLACLRYLGLPARYVSGYMLTHPPEGKPKLVGADESHAWVSVWCPGFGWVDFDPTNNLIPTNEHIVVGWGRDYADVSPVNGYIVGGGNHALNVSVDVQML